MLRYQFALVAAALAASASGCTQCDTCDDFPLPCAGGSCGEGFAPPMPAGSFTTVAPGVPEGVPIGPPGGPFSVSAATRPTPTTAVVAAPSVVPPTAPAAPESTPPPPMSVESVPQPTRR
jgi:hypothetical protein